MENFKYTLEPYSGKSSRYRCPNCEKNQSFTRYVNVEKAEYLAHSVGICNRKIKCGYHYSPKMFFADNKHFKEITRERKLYPAKPFATNKKTAFIKSTKLNPSYLERRYLQKSQLLKTNNFIQFISSVYNEDAADYVKDLYQIGSSTKWPGAAIFWQIDQEQKIRTGKLMQYNPETGKRTAINWVHSLLKLKSYNLQQCLFGLHLLNYDKSKSIAIVESEKTAIIASLAFPEFLWMASGGLNNLKTATVKALKNRRVILFPDSGCYKLWEAKISQLPKNIDFEVSSLLETHTSNLEQKEGYDIADYVLNVMLEHKKNILDNKRGTSCGTNSK